MSIATLPAAASDDEKYCYLGPQQRWFIVARVLAFGFLIASFVEFSYHDPRISSMLLVLLLLAGASAMSLYTSTRRRRMSLADHLATIGRWPVGPPPSVDVFLPSVAEPIEVLANTYRHVAALRYPGTVTVYVLDDGGREDVHELAESMGFRYLSRADRGRAKKAGNLRFGWSQSSGDVVAIVDADFAVRPDFLLELAPYLDDPAVGLVQSPQYFDSRAPKGWLERSAGVMQEFFYRWVQPSRDALDAPICVGTCALYRRAALDRVGGFPAVPHSEDVYTGAVLMGGGYRVSYVPVILAKGLCPAGLHAYLAQQYRWCLGSISLMVDGAFRRMALHWRQRLCFWTGFAYYITTAVTAFTALIPPVYLLWLDPQAIHASNYLLLVPTVLCYPLIAVMHRGRWTFGVMRLEIAYSFAHAVAIWDVWRGEQSDWVVTGAGERTPLSIRIGALMCAWLVPIQLLLWAGLGRTLEQGTVSITGALPLVAFAALALYLTVPLLVAWWPGVRFHRAAAGRTAVAA